MRVLVLCAALTLAIAASPAPGSDVPATAAASPAAVTYLLGGVVSGPYRLSADLVAGTVEEARPPPGRFGDGARIDPWTMPATFRHALTGRDRRVIRELAASLLSNGVASPAKCPATAPPPPPDAVVAFAITPAPGAEPRRLWAAAACLSDDAARLQRVLHDAAQP